MWSIPDGDLQLDPPLDIQLSRPDDVEVPECRAKKPNGQYMLKLTEAAKSYEEKRNFKGAAFLYAVMVKATSLVYNGNAVNINMLYVQAKLAQNLGMDAQDEPALKVVKNALELAEQLKSAGDSSSLFEPYVILTARTLVKVCARLGRADTIDSLTRARQKLRSGGQKVTQLIGENEIGKMIQRNERVADQRIRDLERYFESKKKSPKQSPNREAQNKNSPQSASPTGAGNRPKSGSGQNLPHRGRRRSLDDSQTSSNFLAVPGADSNSSRPRSAGGAIDGARSSSMGNDAGHRPRSASAAGIPKLYGKVDTVQNTAPSTDPFQWAASQDGAANPVNLLEKTHKFLGDARYNTYPLSKSYRRVRIAVLDTGVNKSLINKKGNARIKKATCTIKGCEDEGEKDDAGHGTAIILLLLDICPDANIYSYKVFKDIDQVDSMNGIVPAIEEAIRDEVDIISLSFGFQAIQPNVAAALRQATAVHKPTLIFAAASNSGGLPQKPVAWPADDLGYFAVFATNEEGRPWDHNPPAKYIRHKLKFGTLGENLKPSQLPRDHSTKSGTSFATPIVAGTAALLLDFAKLKPDRHYPAIKHVERLHEYRGMEALLQASSREFENGIHFVKPWNVFEAKDWKRDQIAFKIQDILQELYG